MLSMVLFWATIAIGIPLSNMQVILTTTIPDSGLTALEGGTINFGCRASSCVQSLQWVQNGTVRYSTSGSPSCVSSLLYALVPLDPVRDSGTYQCRALLANGTVVVKTTGMIIVAPIDAPPDQYVLYGSTTTLNCSVPTLPYAIIIWYNNTALPTNVLQSPVITDASLSDDHAYVCEGVINATVYGYKTVNLHVIAPPTILASPSAQSVVLPSVQLVNMSVYIQSRPSSATSVTWYKNGNILTNASNVTVALGDLQGYTSLIMARTTARQDGGVYTVAIANSLVQLRADSRYVLTNFALQVKVLPATPYNVNITSLTATYATVSWSLSPLISDEYADSITVALSRSDGSIASVTVVGGATRTAILHYLPGLDYQVRITTTNMDGNVTTEPVTFTAPYGSPQILGWSIRRINYTAYSFVINLGSNGGANTIQVNISCRQVGAGGGWSPTLVVLTSPPGGPALTGVATSQQFTPYSGPYEFQLSVVNGAYFQSALIGGNETVDLPGAPDVTVTNNSSTRSSAILAVHLSNNGSPPILQVVAMVAGIQGEQQLHNSSGPYLPGATVYIPLEGLQEGVQYVYSAYAVNYAGAGSISSEHSFTIPEPPMLWIIAAVTIPCVLVIIGVVVAVLLVLRQERHKRTLRIGLQPRPLSPIKSGDSSTNDDSSQLGSSSKTTLQTVSEHVPEDGEQKYPRYTYRINPSPDQSVRSIQLPSFLGMDGSRESLAVTTLSQATDV